MWDRLPGETDAPWYAFTVFRDGLKHPRNLTQVSQLTHDVRPPEGYAYQTLQQWSSEFEWFARARAFDEHRDRVAQRAAERAIETVAARIARKQLEAGEGLLDAARAATARLKKDGKRGLLKPNEVSRLTRDGTHVTQLARGEATERVETKTDYSLLSPEELEAARRLRDKARGKT